MTNALLDSTTGISSVEFGTIDFPADWCTTQLGEVLEIIRGVTYKGEEAVYADAPGYLPILRATNIGPTLDFEALVYVPAQRVSKNQRLRLGDIVVAASSGSRAVVGKAALLKAEFDGSFGAFCYALRPDAKVVDPRFLVWYLQTSDYRNRVSTLSAGVSINNLRKKHIESLPFAIPPLDEQQQIVAEIETQFARLDNAVASLKRARLRLKRYRASVLKAACEGRLVPTEAESARQEGRDYEPASVLLERIKAERDAAQAQGRGKAKATFAVDTISLLELPKGWAWTTLGEIKEFSLYGPRFSSDDYSIEGRAVLRTSDISEGGKVNLTTAPRLKLTDSDFQKYRANQGDLLITRTGSLGTLAVFNDTVEAIPGAYLIQYRLNAPEITSWYVFYLLKSSEGQRLLVLGGAGVGRPNLNAPTIESIPIPLPPTAEQSRIVAEIERLTSLIDQMEATVEANLKRIESLRQSILRRAFSGRLLAQDAAS